MSHIAMRRGFVLGLATLALPAAWAEQVQVDIRNARPGKQIDVSVRSAGASGATSGQVDAAGSLTALLAVANLGKAKPAQATVQVAECTDTPDRLTVVGEGADPKETCENGHTSDGCSCQEIGGFLLDANLQKIGVDWEARTLVESVQREAHALGVAPQPSKFSLSLGAGGELNVFKREGCSAIDGFSATCNLDRSGVAPLFFVELGFLSWLWGGVAFEPIDGVNLERDLVSLDTPGLTGTLRDGHFDPKMLKAYFLSRLALTDDLGIYGHIGIGRWWARSGRTITLRFEDQSLVDTSSQEDSGYAPVIGLGLDFALTRRFGMRLGWEYAKLDKEEANIDTHMNNVRALFLFRPGGR